MPDKPSHDPEQARMVDALLRKLPHAQADESKPKPTSSGSRPAVTRTPQVGVGKGPPPPATAAWWRVGLAVLLGVAVTQWPYARECGGALIGYGLTLILLLGAAGWASVYAWRAHAAVAHVLALASLAWGMAATAAVILPRVGYAKEAATWTCRAPAPAPVNEPAVVPATADSVPVDSAAPAADSVSGTGTGDSVVGSAAADSIG